LSAGPLKHYQQLIASGEYLPDPVQRNTMQALDDLHDQLAGASRVWRRWFSKAPAPAQGLYLWGGVGRGKTWMMDLFFDSLPIKCKQRLHFHRFMARVHQELGQRSSVADPLPDIASQWAREVRVLCFDEFFVSDIADAMLLAGLLEALFEQGLVLVATSNIHPDELYRGGLQRARFLPAIALLKRYTRVHEVAGQTDFRLRILKRTEIFHHPLDEAAERCLEQGFQSISGGLELAAGLDINGRAFTSRKRGDGVIWFDFDELCRKPRATLDYIELARSFNTVLLSGVPVLDDSSADAARRFINLVDEFYDRNVKLLISAESSPDGLYSGERLSFEFQRTVSRLIEMQSLDYLARPHLP